MFRLHERLAADTVELARWELSLVLLMNDSTYPWLVLVPVREGVSELHQLPSGDRAMLMDEIVRAQRALTALAKPDKLNVAALGNQVPQLHVHVIGRYRDDPAWPRPVWGVCPAVSYSPDAALGFRHRFLELA